MSKWDKKKHESRGRKYAEEPSNSACEDEEEDEDDLQVENVSISVRICLWEFGQNDPKR